MKLLLTAYEAAEALLLTLDNPTPDQAEKRLNRLVDAGLLRPCVVGKHRRYWVKELERFIEARTNAHGGLGE